MLSLSKDQAQLVMLKAQNLLQKPQQGSTREDVLRIIQQMGALQIDTINVVARSPYLSLWSRLGEYDPAWLEELLPEKKIFEYWSHAACFLPAEDFPYYRRLCLDGLRTYYSDHWYEHHQEDCTRVLEYIRENGEVKSSTFERKDGKSGGWWDWKIEKDALEYWLQQGRVMISRREHFQRVYDLTERLMPEWNDAATPALDETLAYFCEKTLDALGLALPSWVADYFRLPKKEVSRILSDFKKAGKVLEIEIDGLNEAALILPRNLPLVEAASKGELTAAHTTLLSPFDALIWDRKRTKQLFGFDYTIEVYLPAHKRIYGYFTLPILHRGKLVGRLEAKAHRQKGVFEVRSIHLEAGVNVENRLAEDLALTIRDCAVWHKTPQVLLQKTFPETLRPALLNYF